MDSKSAKIDLGFNPEDMIIASFGHIQSTKRAEPILKAFHRISNKHSNIRYVFVGKPDDLIGDSMAKYIEENGLSDRVIITGYTTLEEFQHYIDAADICVNLRYPYNGETSASLMRILSKGKCVLINDIGSFGEIPDDCCIKLPSVENMTNEEEVDKIADAFRRLISDDAKRQDIELQARKYAEEYLDIHRITKEYARIINTSHTYALSKELLSDIVGRTWMDQYSKREKAKLACTLAYSKGAGYETRTQDDGLSAEEIMRDIRKVINTRGRYTEC